MILITANFQFSDWSGGVSRDPNIGLGLQLKLTLKMASFINSFGSQI